MHPGFERLPAGTSRPRHAHFSAYVSVILQGGYDQAGYFGRASLAAGDVLVQPVLDRHESRHRRGPAPHVLRLPWRADTHLGEIHRPRDLDAVIRIAERDPREASALLEDLLKASTARTAETRDWPDLLAAALRSGPVSITRWAEAQGLARETVARGFTRSWGVSARQFQAELRARLAWIRALSSTDGLADIAADLGYADQSHMTRAVGALTGAPPGTWRQRVADETVRLQAWRHHAAAMASISSSHSSR